MQNKISMINSYVNSIASAQNGAGLRAEEQLSVSPLNAHKHDPNVPEGWKHDEIMSNSLATKLNTNIEQGMEIPAYAYRGMMGDPDFNFFEYLQLSKVPYYIGGPVLIGMFAAGKTLISKKAGISAAQKAKQVAMGVALYYVGAALAKAVIDIPVKFFRGVDMNHPYRDIVDLRAGSPVNPDVKKKKEFHKVFESVDFTRWDLLTENKREDGREIFKDHRRINSKFDKMAKKYGIDESLLDSDSTLKEKVKQTLIMSRAWKYALTVPFVITGIGMAHQDVFKTYGDGLKGKLKGILDKKEITQLDKTKLIAKKLGKELLVPFKESFVHLWKGKTPLQGIGGKFIILAAGLGTLYANASILLKTHVGYKKAVDIKEQK